MRKDLLNIRYELQEIAEKEATQLFRLAWRMQAHGCDPANVARVRNEAMELHMTGYPERLLDPFATWDYAFKI
jgi:hypothetical protein